MGNRRVTGAKVKISGGTSLRVLRDVPPQSLLLGSSGRATLTPSTLNLGLYEALIAAYWLILKPKPVSCSSASEQSDIHFEKHTGRESKTSDIDSASES